jgi:hypothetical protein
LFAGEVARDVNGKTKERMFTQRATETQRTQREKGHDISCPYKKAGRVGIALRKK